VHISKVEISNFRSHKNTVVELSESNILIGQNNSGKTAFLEAINYALSLSKNVPSEDDFFAIQDDFNPKVSDPIKIVLELRETVDERFSDNVQYKFENKIQYDEEIYPDDPIAYIKLCYEFRFDDEKGRYVDERYFLDKNSQKIHKSPFVTRDHLSFIPCIFLATLRDINKEIKSKSSFWGKLKRSIDYKHKEVEIQDQIEILNDLILKDNETVDTLIEKLRGFKTDVDISSDSLEIKAFSNRNWEILDGLNIYLKKSNCDLVLPISKHGMGSQSIATFYIFNAYLDLILPKVVENEDATPIICIEEPEAHVHPHAQRSIFQLISKMSGQKLISTHSPFVVDQADIYDYVLLKNEDGITTTKRIPQYQQSFKFKYGLPEAAYKPFEFLARDEELLIKRYVQYRNTELFFSSIFILCEGDTEKVLLERFFPYYKSKTPGQFGISVISCGGQVYSPFLKIANKDALGLKWYILSDAESKTKHDLENTIKKCGYDYDIFKNQIVYLPFGMDMESYYIDFYGKKIISDFISIEFGSRTIEIFKKELEKELSAKNEENAQSIDDFSEEQILNKFIDRKGKVKFAENFASYVIENKLEIPDILKNLIDKAIEAVENG